MCRLISPKTTLRRRKSAFPPCRCMLCRPHPLRGANPQRFLISSIYIPRRKSQRGVQPVLYPVCWFTVSALINAFRRCVTASVTESAQADAGQIFSGSRSPVAVCHRAALLIGLPLCLQRSGYLSRFACAGLSPVGATQHVPSAGLEPAHQGSCH